MKIQLGPEVVVLTDPGSPSLTLGIIRLCDASPEAGLGAALAAACKPMAQKAGVKLDRADLGDGGGRMYDWLIWRGLTYQQVGTAGNAALNLLIDALPKQPEVEAAEGNSEPTP